MNKERLFFIVVLILGILTLLVVSPRYFTPKTQISFDPSKYISEPIKLAQERQYWTKKIDEVGAEKAYEEYKKQYSQADLKTQHVAGHMFSSILYEKKGAEGISVCDSTFAFACYHVIIARILAEKGFGEIPKLDDLCLRKHGKNEQGCQHGVGHGIIEFLGYSKENLMKAIDLCQQTTEMNPFIGCKTGAFMEYMMPIVTIDNSSSIEWKKFNPESPYEPCNLVPASDQPACYSQIALWWQKVLKEDYEKIGSLCLGIDNKKNRDICVFGAGIFNATMTGYKVDATISNCQKMKDERLQIVCRMGAYLSYNTYAPVKDYAPKICSDLNQKLKETCLSARPAAFNNNRDILNPKINYD